MGPQGPADIQGALAGTMCDSKANTIPWLGLAENEGCRIQSIEGHLQPTPAEVPELKPLGPEAGTLCLY